MFNIQRCSVSDINYLVSCREFAVIGLVKDVQMLRLLCSWARVFSLEKSFK